MGRWLVRLWRGVGRWLVRRWRACPPLEGLSAVGGKFRKFRQSAFGNQLSAITNPKLKSPPGREDAKGMEGKIRKLGVGELEARRGKRVKDISLQGSRGQSEIPNHKSEIEITAKSRSREGY